MSPRDRAASVIVRSATVLGLAWLGDALIYVVMPLHAAAFGIGLLGVAAGSLYPAAAVIVVTRATLASVGPVLAIGRGGGSRVERLAAFATWADCGLAAGPLLAGLLYGRVGVPVLYAALACLLAVALLVHRRGTSPRPTRTQNGQA